ncbi:MAG TPA: glycoside hydrolase family 2 protein, partial [Acetobacteraceae bacterium]|nr:glycoside hydrolase family 2 protein [Acetobacteraceae bacterium]
ARIGPSRVLSLCRVGFRRIEVDRGADGRGFALRVNGVPVFCRGSAWTGAELLSAPGEVPDSREVIALARQAGMNMLRVPGTTLYPDPAFHRACDEAGVLVWQDFMFARFDYPAAMPQFRAAVEAEARQLLERLQGSPSLAVLCGGTEVAQQAAMLGLPPESWSSALYDHLLPAIASELRPDVPYVPNAPCGPAGELPFRADSGVAHYFGVTGYLRPFEDVRTADVRFAAECLAVSHVPDAVSCAAFGLLPHGAGWKAGVPRDMGASWDFEDVREHYLAQLYGVDPPRLRREDPERWLALSRAVTSDMLEAVFAEWRRPESRCAGGLTIALQDVLPGAGWGVLDARGRPKPAWHALRRAFRPVQLILLDEGMNGIALHVLNETAERISGTVSVDCWRGAVSVARGRHPVAVPPRGTLSLLGEDLFGGFFDAMNTWRFGPLQHDVVLACLDADGALPDDPPLASAALFPAGRNLARAEIGLTARLVSDHDQHVLVVTASRFAQGLIVEDEAGYIAAADHVHLAPGRPLRIALWPGRDAGPRPHGRVYALNAAASATYGHI